MIRDRDCGDYELIFDLKISDMVKNHDGTEPFVWIDMCCGEGIALSDASRHELKKYRLRDKVKCIGVDRRDIPVKPMKNLEFHPFTDVSDFKPETKANLITCVCGLYLIDDRIAALSQWYNHLNEGGLLAFNLPDSCVEIKVGEKPHTLPDLLKWCEKIKIDEPGHKAFVGEDANDINVYIFPHRSYKITKDGQIKPFDMLTLLETIKPRPGIDHGTSRYVLKEGIRSIPKA